MKLIIRKSRKKALCVMVAGVLAGVAGWLVLHYVHDVVLGWCIVLTAAGALSYGVYSYFDRRPRIVVNECGIRECGPHGEPIAWEAVRYADDFFGRGQYWVRVLIDRRRQPQGTGAGRFRRYDRLYAPKGLRAVYLRTTGLEADPAQLVALIRRMKEASRSQRIEWLGRGAEASRRTS